MEVEVATRGAGFGRAIVPSGVSTGAAEAVELRDGDARRYQGMGVRRAVDHVNRLIGPALIGMDSADQAAVDRNLIDLDGTDDKSRLGANAVLGASLATAHAAASTSGLPLFEHFARLSETGGDLLPMPMVNVLSGGLHASGAVDFQDYLIIPTGAPSYHDALAMVSDVLSSMRTLLVERGQPLGLADEGGYGPHLPSNEEGLALLLTAVKRAGYLPGQEVCFALDVAASHFYRDGHYRLAAEGRELTTFAMVDYLERLCREYPVVSLEDGLAEEDWDGWAEITRRLGSKVQILGDDLFATHASRIRQGIERAAANAVLIKMNQVGTVSETLESVRVARDHGYQCVISARSGETEDSSIADFAVGTGAGQIKVGSLQRSSRGAKWNQLLRIEEELSARACWRSGWPLTPQEGKSREA